MYQHIRHLLAVDTDNSFLTSIFDCYIVRFAYTSDFDTHGILYYLGTQQRTHNYSNPLDIGAVRVLSAPLKSDSDRLSVFVGRDEQRGVVDNVEGGWFTVDFLLHAILPTHYSLRHYNSKDSHALRSWRFEASNNGHHWDCLREHKIDTGMYRTTSCYRCHLENTNTFSIHGCISVVS
jgi:hypothetical protein